MNSFEIRLLFPPSLLRSLLIILCTSQFISRGAVVVPMLCLQTISHSFAPVSTIVIATALLLRGLFECWPLQVERSGRSKSFKVGRLYCCV